MNTIRNLLASALFASLSVCASAQNQPPAGDSAPAGKAAVSGDCAKPIPRHDHGAERGSPRPIAKAEPCIGDAKAAAPAASASATKKKPIHDHTKFHKGS